MSDRSTISVLACGMSIPDSMMLVRDEHVGVAAQERGASRCSSSCSSIWPCATSKRSSGHSAAQPLGGLVDRLDAVVEEERLAAAGVLAHERLRARAPRRTRRRRS